MCTQQCKHVHQIQCSQYFHCCHCSRCVSLFLHNIHTKIFVDGFWDKIFDTAIVTTIVCTLGDTDGYISWSAGNFLTTATAQGAFCCFHGILVLKYSQRGFGTSSLTPRLLPHLDLHSVIKTSTSETL